MKKRPVDGRVVRPAVEREVDEEVAFHVEMRARELIAMGMTPDEARAEALRSFGDVERIKADLRRLGEDRDTAVRRRQWWDDAWQDLIFALRQLRRAPSFAVVAIVTLALAIGANTAVFSVVEGVLLKPLPYGHPERLAAIWARFLPSTGYDIPKSTLGPGEVLDYKEETRAFSSVTAFERGESQALAGGDEAPQEVGAWLGDASMLSTLEVKPALGHWFTKAEDTPGGPAVVVLTHGLWVSRYGSDPSIVGRRITMNGEPTQVVGVLPAGFSLAFGETHIGVYLPLRLARSNENRRGGMLFGAIGRLAPGATMKDVDAEMAVLNRQRAQASSFHDELWAAPLKTDRLGSAPHVLYLFLAAVGFVLLVACANVANLLLARGERRHDELAVRTALGAGRERIVRQIVTECLVLSALALLLALPLAWFGTKALVALDPTALPRLGGVRVGRAPLLFTLGLTLVTTLLFGLAPAVLTGGRAGAELRSTRAIGGRRRGMLRSILVTVEVAVSLVVVIVAGLLVRSFRARVATDPGFRAADVLAFDLTLPASSYPDLARVGPEYEQLLDKLRAVPGVISVSGASAVPFGRHMLRFSFWLEGRSPPTGSAPAWNAVTSWVMPHYFRTMGIPVLKGRPITAEDAAGAPLVAVVNETAAHTFWPGQSPLDKRYHYGRETRDGPWITIVGVVPDQLRYRVGERAIPEIYLSMLQPVRMRRDLSVVIHTSVDPASLTSAVRSAVRRFDADLPMSNVHTMASALASSMAQPRLATDLLATFALLALVLAAVGLYGVVSYSVAGRRREIGVRVALGADRGNVVRLIVRDGTVPALVGIVVGLAGAWLATRLVTSMLYDVGPTDLLTFTVLPLLLVVVALTACLLPALRATRIAPTEALQEE